MADCFGSPGSYSVNYNAWGLLASTYIPSGFAFRFPVLRDLCIQELF
jgi:hypothetical protein